ncbi:hypothetical protein TTHERM_000161279 (macronuclear) [Tetrahymena thermophila SB210]|uniref:Uncharacterized protein n=1 Tax=Tetrahymena thermophila (strain SB210) TaxID=312017 RepID=W7XJU6_TETTS|nr:hypothetical protein TTHERM_000161279 [Tetrahymena thermophila SB210]EWS75956.1 hypothetical protein TTHERM_000161279 [Tetrahymena thermophila SB210]|eukprot:XP_012651474.1 hypothetical protein TTHERM_000161279 [Tetrahymena thermophila SB210]
MRQLKTSISQRRQQSVDTYQLELQTPTKNKQASYTSKNFFQPNTFHSSKGFTSTHYRSPGSAFGGSTINNNGKIQDEVNCDTILLSSQQKLNALQHLQGFSSSQKAENNSNHKLNFLSSNSKNDYVGIKTKRINDLNTLYTEGDNTDFNSQNVFMNKLVYQPNSAAATSISQATTQPLQLNTKSYRNSESYFNADQQIINTKNDILYQKNASQGSLNPLKFEGKYLNSSQKAEPQFQGLENFVKTMYKTGESGFYKSRSSLNFNSLGKTFYSAAGSQRESDHTFTNATGFLDEQEGKIVKPNTYKTKDLFITKINNTFITPKYIYFQSQPQSTKFQKRNSLLDKNATNQFNQLQQSKYIEKQGYLPSYLNTNESKLKSQKSQESQQTLSQKNDDSTLQKIASQSHIQINQQVNYIQDDKEEQEVQQKQLQRSKSQKNNRNISMQSSILTEFYLHENLYWDFEYLFIFINNLSQVKRKNNLKYTFMALPQMQNMMSQAKLQNDFMGLKEQLKTKLQINSKDIYLFLDDGTPVNSHMDILKSDNKERRAVFLGGSGGFCGVSNLFISLEQKANLVKVINGLIEHSLIIQEKKFSKQEDPAKSQGHIGQTRPSTQNSELKPYNKQNQKSSSQKDLEELKSEEFQTKEQFLKKQNKEVVDRVVNILTHNPYAKIKRFEQGVDNPRIRQLQKIEDLYEKQIREFKKSGLEVEASSSLGDNPEKQQTKNLRQIAEFIDEFLEKNFPESNKPLKHAVDHYSSLINNMQQKPSTKRNFVQENIQKFNSPQMAMKYIQNINRELFVKNIPKVLSKYELSRHDLHSIYILYKALLTVSIQRIDWKEVAKGGIDFKTFEHGIDKISSQSEEIIRRMCNYENFIDWKQFIDILYAVSGKTLESKIDIFIKVADTDRGGTLSKEEISELCYICLDKILPKEGEDDSMVQGLVEYFTRLLFTSLDVDPEEDIPLHKLKNAIIEGHPENDLLCFFCGVEYTK